VTRGSRSALGFAVAMALLTGAAVSPARAASGDLSPQVSRTWGVNGRVLTIEPVGDQVLVGGDFTTVLDPDGVAYPVRHLARFTPATGEFDTSWDPGIGGSVTSVSVDGGVVYVGGAFGQVAGQTRRSLAAIDLTTAGLLPWHVDTDVQVDDVEVRDGWVYAAGPFTRLTDSSGEVGQPYLTRIATESGLVDRTWTFALEGRARTLLAPADRDVVFVGGDFTAIDGAAWAGKLAALSRTSPTIDPTFRSGTTNLQYRAPSQDLDLRGNDLLAAVSGSGGGCALLDATTGATKWSKHGNGDMVSVAFHGEDAYCGGHFSGTASFDNLDRYKLAAIDVATGAVQPFAPVVNTALGVWALASTPDMLVVGGEFTKVDTTSQSLLATFRDVEAVAAPSTPRGVAARPGSGQVLVSWSTPSTDGGSPITRYRVLRREGATAPVQVGSTTQRSFADSSALNGHTYTYSLIAPNAVGDGPVSGEASATPMAGLTSVPSVPRSFTATGGVNSVALTWTAPSTDGGSAITAIRVLRGTAPGQGDWYTDLPGTSTSWTDTDVVNGTRYYYQLAAVNDIGAGPLTSEKSAVPALGVPSKPVLTVTTAPARAYLSWTVANPGAAPVTKYIVTRDSVRLVTISNGATTTYTDSSVVSGSSYRYQVKAYNALGWSPYSTAVTAVVP
jgi:Fibronectin type III domain